MSNALINEICWNSQGLLAAIAQDAKSGRVLMMAWMNEQALRETLQSGYATYWSRSRQSIWHKGVSSGHRQRVVSMALDCDGDALLLQVEQAGGIACHTGRESCFYRQPKGDVWESVEPVIKPPEAIYGKD